MQAAEMAGTSEEALSGQEDGILAPSSARSPKKPCR